MACNLLTKGVYWGYNPLTNLLLPSWDIQVVCLHLYQSIMVMEHTSNFIGIHLEATSA